VPPDEDPQSPVPSMMSAALPEVTRFSPGLGIFRTLLVGLLQVLVAMLATSISGSALKAVLSLEPPETVIGAQFIYISGPPLSLANHVQANVAFPLGMLSGSSKSNVKGPSTPGQPPSMLLITLKTELAEGSVSVVTLSWQEPPP
jgi:hypothetical protein